MNENVPAAPVAPTAGNRAKVFVSYSRKDAAFAQMLVGALAERGFDAFLDKTDIRSWIEEADASCTLPVLHCTEVSQQSDVVGHERLGRADRKSGYVRYGPTATKFFSAAACRDGPLAASLYRRPIK